MTCKHCGQELREWVEFCPNCAEPIEGYARPAGFWIRVGASIVDFLVFIPIAGLSIWNAFSLRSIPVLIAVTLPGFLYKPLMESYFGATLGKMACGIKVVDDEGNKLSVFRAYTRALPFLVGTAFGLIVELARFTSPEFQAAETWSEAAQVRPDGLLNGVNMLISLLIIIDCVVVAFTPRKRALHDMLAESYCVYREPQAPSQSAA